MSGTGWALQEAAGEMIGSARDSAFALATLGRRQRMAGVAGCLKQRVHLRLQAHRSLPLLCHNVTQRGSAKLILSYEFGSFWCDPQSNNQVCLTEFRF